MLVEGAFDRLTLVAAGLPASQIVALVGTALQVEVATCAGENGRAGP